MLSEIQRNIVKSVIKKLLMTETTVISIIMRMDFSPDNSDNEKLMQYEKRILINACAIPLCNQFFMVHTGFEDDVEDMLLQFLMRKMQAIDMLIY